MEAETNVSLKDDHLAYFQAKMAEFDTQNYVRPHVPYGTYPTYGHWVLVNSRGCYTEMQEAAGLKRALVQLLLVRELFPMFQIAKRYANVAPLAAH